MIDLLFTPVPPVTGAILVSRQGQRSARRYWHNGIDLSAPLGIEMRAIGPGTVSAVTRNGENRLCGYGNAVVVEHAANMFSLYGHMDTQDVVEGQEVAGGERIGTVGNSFARLNRDVGCIPATMNTPHLHLEFWERWPEGSADHVARLDVLEVLAAGGLGLDSNGSLAVVDPFEYREPALAALDKSAVVPDEIASPALVWGRWYTVGLPVAVILGTIGSFGLGLWISTSGR